MPRKYLLKIMLGFLAPALAEPVDPPKPSAPPSEERCSTQYQGQRDRTCGAAAVAEMLDSHYGDQVSAKEVFADLWLHSDSESHRQGFSMLDMKNYLIRRGYEADGFAIGLDELEMSAAPAIAIVNPEGDSAHFVLIRAVSVDHVLVSDPAFGLARLSRDSFSKIWKNGILFLIRDNDKLEVGQGDLAAAWKRARPEREYLAPIPPRTAANPPVEPIEAPAAPGPPPAGASTDKLETAAPAEPGLIDKLAERGVSLKANGRVQSFVAHTNYADPQPFNYRNSFARQPTTELNTELRPLIGLNYGPLELLAKPRLRLQWDHAEFGPGGRETEDDFQASVFLLEGWARLALWDRMFVSYGREALLWGPAMYITPSNPFFISNNRSNPYREIRGRDYAKATYLINDQWTASFISNVGLGLDDLAEQSRFRRTDALKLDFTGIRLNGSLVASRRDDDLKQIGGFLQWTFNDALLLYLDGQIGFGGDALYAQPSPDAPGWTWSQRNRSSLRGLGLAGGSYTFEIGPTISVEYVYNSAGYTEREADAYFDMANDLSAVVRTAGPGGFAAGGLLARAQAPGLSLLRKNYLFVQFLQTSIFESLDITVRYTQNLDDGGSDLVPILDWSVGESTHLFALSALTFGGRKTEAKRYLDNQVFFGINYTFGI